MAAPPDPGRRLGERIPIGDVFLTWRADERRPRAKSKEPDIARLLNISVSGGAVVAPMSKDLHAGAVVSVQMGNAHAAGRIKRIEEFDEPDWRVYAIEFVETEPEFLDWITHLLDAKRPTGLKDAWDHAW